MECLSYGQNSPVARPRFIWCDVSDDGCEVVCVIKFKLNLTLFLATMPVVLEKWCRKIIQTGLLVRTIMDELQYFIYSSRRENAEVWRCWKRRILRRMSRIGWDRNPKLRNFVFEKKLRTMSGKNRKEVCSEEYVRRSIRCRMLFMAFHVCRGLLAEDFTM